MATGKHARAKSSENVLKHPSTKRAKEIDANPPLDELTSLLEKSDGSLHSPRNVLHWFRSKDLRAEDNRGLHAASKKAREGEGSLVTLYLHSPKDLEWHGTSPARSDFVLESLRILQSQLEKQRIPLKVVEASDRSQIVQTVLDFVNRHDISHVYANLEYEFDELRRDVDFAKQAQGQKDLHFEALHDQTVMVPGELTTGSGGPHKVFTPYHKAWLAEVAENPKLYDTLPGPEPNEEKSSKELEKLFGSKIPGIPEQKQFASSEERDRLRKLWPAGHEAGLQRCQEFLDKKVADYATHRSEPARDCTSRLSPYFASGVISVREALQKCRKANSGKKFDSSGDGGIAAWVREIVFREFYRQVMVVTPHNSLNLPHNLKFDSVQWEADEEGWQKWCEGKTGVPFIDAGMRQLAAEAYMHNRLRMNVSSYLSGNMLLDYRRGERYFAEHLVDWDLCNNTQGWEPSYTIFNPVIQAEKNDPKGDYIRRWVPELRKVEGKAVFSPHDRLDKAEFEKLGYPRPHVDFRETAQRAKERYKHDLAKADL